MEDKQRTNRAVNNFYVTKPIILNTTSMNLRHNIVMHDHLNFFRRSTTSSAKKLEC